MRARRPPALEPPDADADRFPGLAAMPDAEHRSAAGDAAMYTVATYGAQSLLFVAGLVQKAFSDRSAPGFWSLMQTFWVPLTMALLGTMHGSTRGSSGTCAAKLAVLSAALAPVLALAELRHRVLSTAWGRMRGRPTAEALIP